MKIFKLPSRKNIEIFTPDQVIKFVALEEKITLEDAEKIILSVVAVNVEYFKAHGTIIVRSEGKLRAMQYTADFRLEDKGVAFKAGMCIALDRPNPSSSGSTKKRYASDMPSGSALYHETIAAVAAKNAQIKANSI